jgi:hypothetical protein
MPQSLLDYRDALLAADWMDRAGGVCWWTPGWENGEDRVRLFATANLIQCLLFLLVAHFWPFRVAKSAR